MAHHLDPSPSPLSLLQTLGREQIVPGDPDDVFAFFADAVNLEAITPPWLRFRIVTTAFVRRDLERIFDFRHPEVARRLGGGRTSGA